MKPPSLLFALLGMALASLGLGAAAPSTAPRLNELAKFPKEHAPAVQAVLAAVTQAGLKPDEYFAEISREDDLLHFWLIHECHDPSPEWRGDSCSRCRTITYDPRSATVSKLSGIR